MTRPRAILCVVAAVCSVTAAGCGSSSEDTDGDAQAVLEELESLKPGERLIKSSRAPRFSGPYAFRREYVFHFRQAEAGRVTVALESQRGSRKRPYQLLVDADARSGTARVAVRGTLHVHVIRAAGPYVLRFTPAR
jgi:hypothetical protein